MSATSPDLRRRAATLYAEPGASYRSVARELEVSPSTARRWIRSYATERPEHGHRWQIEWGEGGSYRWVCANEGCERVLGERAETSEFLTDCEGAS